MPDIFRHRLLSQKYTSVRVVLHHILPPLPFTMTPKIVDMGRDLVKEIKAVKRDYQDSQSHGTQPYGSQVSGTGLRYRPQLISLSSPSLGPCTPPNRLSITQPPVE